MFVLKLIRLEKEEHGYGQWDTIGTFSYDYYEFVLIAMLLMLSDIACNTIGDCFGIAPHHC